MENEFVNIPVPRDRVQEVYELLASPPRRSRAVGSTPTGGNGWPPELLTRAYRESPPPMKVVLSTLMENADEWVTAEELTRAVSKELRRPAYSRRTLAGVFGAFGRRWKNRYAGGSRKNGQWPFEAKPSPEHGMFRYRMARDVAEVMQRAR